ncbi:ubiquitin carboxyl-terminal hydrolase 14 [Angomonas deanei]|nr:ubiquitin carboxyl-terminal hydrolase 14 [Angomonas deanei]|eukprot:EPY43318.1 ubiquitin carboxyl-terminal hydrolase 14 [Angomonas deanei]
MSSVKIKWGKETLEIAIDLESTVQALKELIKEKTGIPIEKQKIMGLKPNVPDTTSLSKCGLAPGKTLMLIGSADTTGIPKVVAVKTEADDAGHSDTSPTSNGLVNFGNTCYMNSALEMVRSIPEIPEAFADTPSTNPLVKSYCELLKGLNSTKNAVTPLQFWTTLCQTNATFMERDDHGRLMQQDAQEALSVVLQEVSGALPPKYTQLLKGTLSQTMKCTEEGGEPACTTTSPFTMLSCNITGEVQTLEAGLQQGFNEEFNARSDMLGREAKFSKVSRIDAFPEYVFVHMIRFSWRNDIQKKAKILKPISFPLILDLTLVCTDELKEKAKPAREAVKERRDKEIEKRKRGRNAEDEKQPEEGQPNDVPPEILHNESGYYELCGVISHKGRSADGGHYVYWGKKANRWLIYDDEHVAEVSEEDVLRLRGIGEAHIAYVLLYRSRDPITKRPVLPL